MIFISCTRNVTQPGAVLPVSNEHYKKAEQYIEQRKLDSAFFYFSKAKDEYLAANDSLQVATSFLQMAITLTEVSDFLGGEEVAFQGLSFLDTTNKYHHAIMAMLYNSLGVSVSRLEHRADGLKYYDKALKYDTVLQRRSMYLNNKAATLYDLKRYKEALAIYGNIIHLPHSNTDNYAMALSNFAKTKWRVDLTYNPLPDFWKAKDIRERSENKWGMNSSYAHLSEYYEDRQIDSVYFYAKKRLAVAQQLSSAQDMLNGLRMLIRISPADQARTLFKNYHSLQDSIQLARSQSRNQFASIRYEVEKSKAENLRLQSENEKKEFRINSQRTVMVALFIIAILLAFSIYMWAKRRQQRLVLEANSRIKNSQLKISRKVHDIVANGLYRVMAEIDYNEEIDRESILDKLEDMYHKSRDISVEVKEEEFMGVGYHEEIARLLKSFANDRHKILIVGNEASIWFTMGNHEKSQIYQVLQELMVNMRKHSDADTVVVRFDAHQSKINIYYQDNGIGLNEQKMQNGMDNTESRIIGIGGTIIFESQENKGLKVSITIPQKK